VLTKPLGQSDRTANVLGLLLADGPVRVERIPVGTEAGDGHASTLEDAEEVVAGAVADQDVVERRNVRGGQQAAGVDLKAGQTNIGYDLDRVW
jgi:hypothetical protein